jgi:hypothetical protein
MYADDTTVLNVGQDIVTCYATKDAVRIGNPFIIILNYT